MMPAAYVRIRFAAPRVRARRQLYALEIYRCVASYVRRNVSVPPTLDGAIPPAASAQQQAPAAADGEPLRVAVFCHYRFIVYAECVLKTTASARPKR